MKTIQCLIVDDEPLAREIIATHISKIPNWSVTGQCVDAESAYEMLLLHAIDVLFLDVQMPLVSGIDFLQSLKQPPLVVFTTAFSEYAVQGFELNALDYLLKPITFSRFYQSVEKIRERLQQQETHEMTTTSKTATYFFVKHDGKLMRIDFSDILYIKAEQEYSYIMTKEKPLLVSMHLKLLAQQLPEETFTRIHRSYIIPHGLTQTIDGNRVQLEDGSFLPIGTTYKETLLKKLQIK